MKGFEVGNRKSIRIGANCVFVSYDVVVSLTVEDWNHVPLYGLDTFPIAQSYVRAIDAKLTSEKRIGIKIVFSVRGIENATLNAEHKRIYARLTRSGAM